MKRLQLFSDLFYGREAKLTARNAELSLRVAELEAELVRRDRLGESLSEKLPGITPQPDSADYQPWSHPFLSAKNIADFRSYSEQVWAFASDYHSRHPSNLNIAFTVNMCQNMYKWASLAQSRGERAVLFPHAMDTTALSRPEWEEFDGHHEDIFSAESFLATHSTSSPVVPCEYVPIETEGSEFLTAWLRLREGEPELFTRLQSSSPGVRHEALLAFSGFYTYFSWAKRLSTFDVVYGCSNPFAAYASGRPYLAFAVGGDLIVDCGRSDDFGLAHRVAFNAARFLTASNPHTLAHCRRLGFTNAVYLPYPMDDRKYCPGEGRARNQWLQQYGGELFVLAPSRIDSVWKGFGPALLAELETVARAHPGVRFVFLGWGDDKNGVRQWIRDTGLADQFIVLPPVGKRRLIDYYRSCDIVLDHFVWGYYGATALEAAAIGKPVVMKLRDEHYHPLYQGDVAPVDNVREPNELANVLKRLIEDTSYRRAQGEAMREWLVRTHGEDRTMPILLALLRVAADEAALPADLRSPLLDELTPAEQEYHVACRRM